MDHTKIAQFTNELWDDSVTEQLIDYIKIPNKSPMFDTDWQKHGFMDEAVDLAYKWCDQHRVHNMQMEIVRLKDRTPLLFIEVTGEIDETVLMYGHLDKQPEMQGWDDDKGPWKPVLIDDRLYGRGGADDGYAVFSSLTAIAALQEQGTPHARCVIIIECCEESGSYDLSHYVEALRERIGQPNLIICLDSGCGNYDQLWCTTSLRGVITADLRVDVLTEGIHSGASGVVSSSFRILRQLLDRIEDSKTGEIKLKTFHVDIPQHRINQAKEATNALKKDLFSMVPFVEGMQPVSNDLLQNILNCTWRPTLSIVGVDGIPPVKNAGNVLRPFTELKLSLRTPPTCHIEKAVEELKKTVLTNSPYHAKVRLCAEGAPGWDAPKLETWLKEAVDQASLHYFNKPVLYKGEGGSIPFMGMLGELFPKAQFMITGVLGPHSNAHGPNEFLHIPTAKKVTCCVAHVLHQHYKNFS